MNICRQFSARIVETQLTSGPDGTFYDVRVAVNFPGEGIDHISGRAQVTNPDDRYHVEHAFATAMGEVTREAYIRHLIRRAQGAPEA